jgi:hypothetical protein
LRALVREHIILGDLDRQGLIFHSTGVGAFNGTVAGGGDGKFTLTQNLHIYPFATAGDASGALPYVASTKSFQMVGTAGNNQIIFTSVQKQFEGTDLELADANKISIEITHTGSLSISVSGPTGEERNILITIDSGTTTCTQVINLVNGDPAASALVTATLESGSTGSNVCDVYDNSVWVGDYARRFLVGGAPGTLHTITSANLAGFFAAHVDNLMKKGDMVGIWYENRISPDGAVDGRLESTPENANTVIPQASLFNSRRESHKIPNCIPLFKCIDDDTVIAADGTRFVKGDTSTFGGAEGSALATPLNWDVIGTGDHTPPTTIREALDNCDYHLNTLKPVVTVTDGVTTTGGTYNGTDALENAITDYGTSGGAYGTGAYIMVRKGTYNMTTQITIDVPIIVEAVEEDVVLNLTLANSTYLFVLASTGLRPAITRFSGLTFQGSGKYVFTSTGIVHCRLEDMYFQTARGIDLQTAERVVMERIKFECEAECLIIGASAVECSLRNVEFVTTSTSVPAFTYSSGAKNFSMSDAYFDMDDNQQAISGVGNGLQLKNIRIDCEPYTAASTVVALSGAATSVEGLFMTVTGSGTILSSLIQMTCTASTLRDMQAVLGDQPLGYTGGNNPFIFGGSTLLVENSFITDLYLPDSGTMAVTEPIVVVLGGGVAQPTTVRHMTITGFTHTGSPSGNIDVCVIGCRQTFIGSDAVFILDDIEVDTSGKTYATGQSAVIANITPESIIKNCRILGSGIFGRAIHVDGAEDVQVRNNRIAITGANWAAGIHVDSNLTTAPNGSSDNCLVDGNSIEFSSFSALAGLFVGDAGDTTFCQRPRVCNNYVNDNSPSISSIDCMKVNAGIVMSNNVLNGITFTGSCTNMKPDGVTIGLSDVNVVA